MTVCFRGSKHERIFCFELDALEADMGNETKADGVPGKQLGWLSRISIDSLSVKETEDLSSPRQGKEKEFGVEFKVAQKNHHTKFLLNKDNANGEDDVKAVVGKPRQAWMVGSELEETYGDVVARVYEILSSINLDYLLLTLGLLIK